MISHFDRIYRKESRYCVMFVSDEYAKRMWTKVERRSALARAATDESEYILPIRVDETDIEGLPPTVAYLSVSNKSRSRDCGNTDKQTHVFTLDAYLTPGVRTVRVSWMALRWLLN